MPDIEEQLKDRMEALAAAQERQGTAEEHCSMVSRMMMYDDDDDDDDDEERQGTAEEHCSMVRAKFSFKRMNVKTNPAEEHCSMVRRMSDWCVQRENECEEKFWMASLFKKMNRNLGWRMCF